MTSFVSEQEQTGSWTVGSTEASALWYRSGNKNNLINNLINKKYISIKCNQQIK